MMMRLRSRLPKLPAWLPKLPAWLPKRQPNPCPKRHRRSGQDLVFVAVCVVLGLVTIGFGALAWIDAESSYSHHLVAVSRCGDYDFNDHYGQPLPGATGRVSSYFSGRYRLETEESDVWVVASSGSKGQPRWCRIVSGLSTASVWLGSLQGGATITVLSQYEQSEHEYCSLALRIKALDGELEAISDTPASGSSPTAYCSSGTIATVGLDPIMLDQQAFIGILAHT